jgi:hypothetical protein
MEEEAVRGGIKSFNSEQKEERGWRRNNFLQIEYYTEDGMDKGKSSNPVHPALRSIAIYAFTPKLA